MSSFPEEKDEQPGAEPAQAGQGTVPQSIPAEPAAVREDQVANAVAFLTHPKVQSSPESTKRAFLEKKGLTADEIAEAFRRVPQAPSPAPTPAAAPAAAIPSASTTIPGSIVPHVAGPAAPHQQPGYPVAVQHVPPPASVRWTQVVLGVGVVAAAAVGVKRYLVPLVMDWYSRYLLTHPSVSSSNQKEMLATLEAMQKTQVELLSAVNSLAKQINQQQQGEGGGVRSSYRDGAMVPEAAVSSASGHGSVSARGWQPPGPAADSSLMAHDGYTRSAAAIRAAGDGASAMPSTASYYGITSQGARVEEPEEAPRSQAFTEVMEMVKAGITPPNVRTDIVDSPPDPTRPFTGPQMKPASKPWEKAAVPPRPGSAASALGVPPFQQPGSGSIPYTAAAGGVGTPTAALGSVLQSPGSYAASSTGSPSFAPAGVAAGGVAGGAGISAGSPTRPWSAPQQSAAGSAVRGSAVDFTAGSAVRGSGGNTGASQLAFSMYQMEEVEQQQRGQEEAEGDCIPAAAYTKPSMFVAAASGSSSYYTPQQQQQQQGSTAGTSMPAGPGGGSATSVPWGDIGSGPAVQKPYDLSSLLGHAPGSSDAPWRPPPPPASTITTTVAAATAAGAEAGVGKSSALSPDAPPFAPLSASGADGGVAVAGHVAAAAEGGVEVSEVGMLEVGGDDAPTVTVGEGGAGQASQVVVE